MTAFAKLTGDLAVLSQADIRVLALTYALEVEKNGTRRLRPAPGKPSQEEQERETKKQERLTREKLQQASLKDQPDSATTSTSEDNAGRPAKLSTGDSTNQEDTASIAGEGSVQGSEAPTDIKTQASSAYAMSTTPSEIAPEDSDEDGGEWITPSNVTIHKSRDLGLFPSLPAAGPSAYTDGQGARKQKAKTLLKVACLTGDYAMQNVALQMGLNVFGVGGKKVKEVRTWVLRCHACFK